MIGISVDEDSLFLSNFKKNKDTCIEGKVGLYGRYIGECSICGRLANYNTPHLDRYGNLFCDNCAWDVANSLLIGISQSLSKNLTYVWDVKLHLMKNGVKLSYYTYSKNAYFSNSTAFPLTEEESEMPDIDLLDYLYENYKSKGTIRCTDCYVDLKLKNVAGRPLFAGVNCDECWEKHNSHLQHQRHIGHVCSLCGDAWDACCC